MAQLEIAFLTGDVERRDLTKQQPVSIGNHSSNDVAIDEPGVELIHCRIAWNKTAYEIVAAGTEPIDINGNLVQRALLKAGDVIRIGSVDITLVDEAGESVVDDPDVGLKPTSGELKSAMADAKKKPEPIKPPAKKAAAKPEKPKPKPKPEPEPEEVEEIVEAEAFDDDDEIDDIDDIDDVADGDWLEGLAAESRVKTPERRTMPERSDRIGQPAAKEEAKAAEGAGEEAPSEKMTDRLRSAMRHQQHRPGEEDSIRSPLILTLLGGSAVLVLAAVTVYFLAWRQTTADEFNAAKQLYTEQKFAPAIKALDEFSAFHPRDPLAEEAERLADLARIDQQIVGGAPKWDLGLTALTEFISRHRDDEDFSREDVFNRAGDIAMGAARDAGKSFNRELLQISYDAVTPYTTYTPEGTASTQRTIEIETAQRAADAAITRHETFEAGVAKLDAELERDDPMAALVTRRDLIARYPEFQNDKTIAAKLASTLETEKGLVTVAQIDQPGVTDERTPDLAEQLTLAFSSRTSTTENSLGQAVWVLSKDCCYGVDTVTGETVWRRVIGFDTPFFPVDESSSENLLLYDTNHEELLKVELHTGKLLWRQQIGERASGEPLIDGGQIYLPTEGGHLYKVDLQTGTISTKVTFSQEVSAPVLLPGGSHLVVAGNREVLYSLTKSPLECVAVTYFAHPADSIQAPLLYLNPYVLFVENKSGASRMRLVNAANPVNLNEVAGANVAGAVVDSPVIRGRDLFIPSIPERVSAFRVSDDTGEPPLASGATFQVEGSRPSPIFLTTGPDRQVWMASSALRRLQLTTDAIEADQTIVAVGIASQPVQHIGGILFNARRRPFTDAVTLTQVEREQLKGEWQAAAGARVLAWSIAPPPNPSLLCVTEAGHVFRITDRSWQEDGFVNEASGVLIGDEGDELVQPLFATPLPDGRLAVAAGEGIQKSWELSRTGLSEGTYDVEEPLQHAPVLLGSRLIFPVQGGLHASYKAGQPRIQPYELPSDEAETTVWRQVLAIDDTNFVAITETGAILQVHMDGRVLKSDNRINLGTPADVLGDVGDGVLLLADANGRVAHYDPGTLDVRAEHTFGEPISNDVWLAAGSAFVETSGSELHRLDVAGGLTPVWDTPHALDGVSLAGRPLVVGDRVVVSLQDGRVRVLGLADGGLMAEANVGAALSDGPFQVDEEVYAWTLDGTLVRLTQLLSE